MSFVCFCIGPKWNFNMYLGKIHHVHALFHMLVVCMHTVFDEMPKWHFVVVLDSDEYQTLGITMFLHS